MRRTIIGIMGGKEADPRTRDNAYQLGRLVAQRGWVMLSGGQPSGVMDASAQGCRDGGGLSVGVLFDDDRDGAARRAGSHGDVPRGRLGRDRRRALPSHLPLARRGVRLRGNRSA